MNPPPRSPPFLWKNINKRASERHAQSVTRVLARSDLYDARYDRLANRSRAARRRRRLSLRAGTRTRRARVPRSALTRPGPGRGSDRRESAEVGVLFLSRARPRGANADLSPLGSTPLWAATGTARRRRAATGTMRIRARPPHTTLVTAMLPPRLVYWMVGSQHACSHHDWCTRW